jgi:hypothetical protein
MTNAQPVEAEAAIASATRHQAASGPGTSLDLLPDRGELAQLLGATVIPVRQWAQALVNSQQFEEENEEEAGLSIVRAILLANTPEAMFAAMNVSSVDEMLGKDPGARSSVFEIYGATPLASTYDEGPSCFCVIQARDKAEGTAVTLSCGARSVQAAILGSMLHGWLPITAAFERKRKPTRRGFYPISLVQGI